MLALPEQRQILGMRVDATSYPDSVERILGWAESGHPQSRYVCVANVHMVMESFDNRAFQAIVNGADLVTPDGMPLVWALRLLGVPAATRVYGPSLVPLLCEEAARRGVAVGFYGGSPEVLERLLVELRHRYPALKIGYAWSPPFRPMTPAEDAATVKHITDSGVGVLFVGLGCPRQERWMAEHRERLRVVMIGVGAAFDFLAGAKRQAPGVLQRAGLEWCFRLVTEPRRLWRRYLYHNPRFLVLLARQLFTRRHQGETPPAGGFGQSARRHAWWRVGKSP
jgi:N-acetylglucosaminyldiphosphoundecaprenol N-acetyl-beta-D-mannosaminyltransferase